MGGGPGVIGRRTLLGAAALAALPAARAAQVDLAPAAHAPFTSRDLDGRIATVPAVGRATVVNFWATWCPPCRAEMPLLLDLPTFYGDRLALQLVNFKERAVTVQRYMRDSNWSHPVLMDATGEGAAAWGVKTFPTTVGFDATGRGRWRVRGEYDWSGAQGVKLVEALMPQKA
jgi:thiol-disulfide isomerase/thioredoxin